MSTAQPSRRRGARAETPITADLIVETAIRLIDERGPQQFSMRSLAAELGVFPATLYWHVGDRQQLIGLVEQRALSSIELPDADDWTTWSVELARRYRANALRHPNVMRLVSTERALNMDALAIPDAILGKLAQLGLGEHLVHAYNALMGAVQGFVLLELTLVAERDPDSERVAEEAIRSLDPQRFPNIVANFDSVANRALSMRWSLDDHSSFDASFEFLMNVLLAGLRVHLGTDQR
jgi:TetR/AcrR family tetracycline transcriptional repressor